MADVDTLTRKLIKNNPLSKGDKSYIPPRKPFYKKRVTPTNLSKGSLLKSKGGMKP